MTTRGFGLRGVCLDVEDRLRGGSSAGVLVLGSEPADEAGGFLFGPLGVKRDEALEDFGVGEGCRPAVGGEHGGVEVIVELAKDGNEALVVYAFFFVGQGLVGAEFLQDVVHPGESESGVLGLDALAVGVEFFGDGANAGLLLFGAGGEWEFLEAVRLHVGRVIANP